jgi:hypothetical protein
VASADNKLTIWDFSVEVDESSQSPEDQDIPPQLMFLHQGQNNIKELRFHPYYREMLITTAEDSYNIFRPNLEPDEDEDEPDHTTIDPASSTEEESKASDSGRPPKQSHSAQYFVDSDEEDEEAEEQRMKRAAKRLTKRLNKGEKGGASAGGRKDGKRRKDQ